MDKAARALRTAIIEKANEHMKDMRCSTCYQSSFTIYRIFYTKRKAMGGKIIAVYILFWCKECENVVLRFVGYVHKDKNQLTSDPYEIASAWVKEE